MSEAFVHYRLHPARHHHGDVPLCELALIGPLRRVPVVAVVDSGATHPVFPKSVAEDAGIDLSRARDFNMDFGGSRTVGRIMRVHLEFLGIPGKRLDPDVVFVDDLQLGYAMLGRSGVFAQFREIAFAEKVRPGRIVFRW